MTGIELILSDLPRVLLEASILLSIAVLVGLLIRATNIPLTVVLAVAGLVVTESGADLAVSRLISGEGFEGLVLNLLLPVLIFETAIIPSTREFMRNLVPIVALATFALVLSAALVGAAINATVGLSISVALLFGVIVSATPRLPWLRCFARSGVEPPADTGRG
ncbi:MAG: cation:proton antiporter [Acidimicrobiia bacterium]|nr:cation:proton antiporter [Acidimicrobiia bacterium]